MHIVEGLHALSLAAADADFKSLLSSNAPTFSGTAINFGANDGIESDPVYPVLVHLGYSCLAVEASDVYREILTRNMREVE